ncbi:MAG: glycosyltransferase family 2 protein [Nitrospirae bacterium]|nr:glycosyltransferase family 2 protein [Nitrospirota bacterium]
MSALKFSIVIPCYNEGEDVRLSLDAALGQDWPMTEVLVVDDASTDGTAQMLKDYGRRNRNLVVLAHSSNRGVASARNTGIRASSGDVVVILNADVSPPPDFLRRISTHYGAGADLVLVESEVSNQSRVYPRFLEAQHHYNYDHDPTIVWSEGFSCRKPAAIEVGLFPERIPGCGGEDAVFGRALCARFKKVIDKSIVVPHVAPATLSAFWAQRVSRGRGAAFTHFFVEGRAPAGLAIRFGGKLVLGSLIDLATFPRFFLSYVGRPQQIHRGWRDLIPFFWANLVQSAGHRWGEWAGWLKLVRRREEISEADRRLSKG